MDRQDTSEVDARAAWDGRQVCDIRRCRIASKFRVIKAVSCECEKLPVWGIREHLPGWFVIVRHLEVFEWEALRGDKLALVAENSLFEIGTKRFFKQVKQDLIRGHVMYMYTSGVVDRVGSQSWTQGAQLWARVW